MGEWRSYARLTTAALVLVAAASCARPEAPTGGERDVIAPVVILTEPDTFARVDSFDEAVVIRFNERISERPSSGALSSWRSARPGASGRATWSGSPTRGWHSSTV